MLDIYYTTHLIFVSISAFVALLVSFMTFKLFKITKNSYHKYFGISFLGIVLSLLCKVAINIGIGNSMIGTTKTGIIRYSLDIFGSSKILLALFLGHRFLMLIGLLGLFMVFYKILDKKQIILYSFLIMIVVLFTRYAYYMFHITAALIILFLIYYYLDNYKKNKKKTSLLVTSSFAVMFLANVLFLFTFMNREIYIYSEITQLISFIILLFALILMRKNKK